MTRRVYAKLVMDGLVHRGWVRVVARQHGVVVPWMRPLADDIRRYVRAHRWWADSFLTGGGR